MDGYSFLQLIKTILIGITAFIAGICMLLPYWYQFTLMLQYNSDVEVPVMLDMGLFYMNKGDGNIMDQADLIFFDKATNAQTFPPMFRVAQIFFSLGATGMAVCFVAALIYCCRKYKSATGEICMAGAIIPSSLCMVIGVVFAFLVTIIKDENSWEAFPVPNHYVRVKADPVLVISYGFYAACVAALLGIGCLVISVMQACSMCMHVENIRERMLYAPLTEDERGVGPEKTYHFGRKPNKGFQYDGNRGEVNF